MFLLRDPTQYGSITPFTGDVADQRTKLQMDVVSGPVPQFQFDETVNGPSGSGTVVEWDDVNWILYLTDILGTFSDGETVIGQDSLANTDIDTGGVTAPELEPYNGTIDYMEHRKQIVRASDQVEEVRVTFEW
jgi:hypothetical protein